MRRGTEERKADPQMDGQTPGCQPHRSAALSSQGTTQPHHGDLIKKGGPQGVGAREGAGCGGPAWPGQLTSDRKVWADFWAPTCSRYSYTYSANLQGGVGAGSGSQEARARPKAPPRGSLGGALRRGTCPLVGRWRRAGAHSEPLIVPTTYCQPHSLPSAGPPLAPPPPPLRRDGLLTSCSAWPTPTHPSTHSLQAPPLGSTPSSPQPPPPGQILLSSTPPDGPSPGPSLPMLRPYSSLGPREFLSLEKGLLGFTLDCALGGVSQQAP